MSDLDDTLKGISDGVDALRTKTDTDLTAIKEFVQSELATVREDLARKNAPRYDAQDQAEEIKAQYASYFIAGQKNVQGLDVKTLPTSAQIGVNSAGGFALPRIFDDEIGQVLRTNSVMRQLGSVKRVGQNYVHLAKDAKPSASLRAETGSVSTGSVSTFSELVVGSYEIYENGAVSVWALDGDASNVIDFQASVRDDILKGMAEQEGHQHMLGTSTSTLNNASGTPVSINCGLLTMSVASNADRWTNTAGSLGGVASITNCVVAFDDLINLQSRVHVNYRANASYLFGSDMESELMQTKDSQGHYLWSIDRTGASGSPATLRGKPYYLTDHMVGPVGAADGAPLVLFGDFSKYLITDQSDINWVVNPYTNLSQVQIHARRRQGAVLTDFQALRVLTNKAAS